MRKINKILCISGVIIIVISTIAGMWFVGRKVNYSLLYKSMVEQTIREMVKPEAIKERQ